MIDVATKVKWNGKDVKIKGEKSVKKSVFEYGIIVEAQAAALAQGFTRTGRLLGSITTQTKDKSNNKRFTGVNQSGDIISKPSEENVALVGSNVNYAPFLEFGTYKMKAQPFLRPAVDVTKGNALNVFKKNGRTELREYFKEGK